MEKQSFPLCDFEDQAIGPTSGFAFKPKDVMLFVIGKAPDIDMRIEETAPEDAAQVVQGKHLAMTPRVSNVGFMTNVLVAGRTSFKFSYYVPEGARLVVKSANQRKTLTGAGEESMPSVNPHPIVFDLVNFAGNVLRLDNIQVYRDRKA